MLLPREVSICWWVLRANEHAHPPCDRSRGAKRERAGERPSARRRVGDRARRRLWPSRLQMALCGIRTTTPDGTTVRATPASAVAEAVGDITLYGFFGLLMGGPIGGIIGAPIGLALYNLGRRTTTQIDAEPLQASLRASTKTSAATPPHLIRTGQSRGLGAKNRARRRM